MEQHDDAEFCYMARQFLFGIMMSTAVIQAEGITPVIVAIERRAASESAIEGSEVPVMISEKEGPKGLAAVFTCMRFQLLVKFCVVI
jgi:hypothetical protein